MSTAAQRQEVATPAPTVSALTPMEMLDRAVQSGAGLETIEKLMGLQERWEKNLARKEFDRAVSEAKAKIKPVAKNRLGHNTKYADFAAIASAVDPIISEYGLSYRFRTSQDDARISVTCVLSHRAGHSEENTIAGPPDTSGSKNAIQAIGSTLTYLQRYSLMQALGLAASADDDGRTGDNSLVTADQAEELAKLIQETSSDINKVLVAFQIESLSDLPARRFEEAKTRIRNAARRK